MIPWLGAIHLYGDPEFPDLIELLQDFGRERYDQVREELLCVRERLVLPELVVEPGGACDVLPEGVVREEDSIFREVGEHRVWPVEHRGFKEGERLPAEVEGIAGLDDPDVPAAGVVVAGKPGLCPLRCSRSGCPASSARARAGSRSDPSRCGLRRCNRSRRGRRPTPPGRGSGSRSRRRRCR